MSMVVIIVVVFVVLAVFGHLTAKKRREAMAGLAGRLGLHFDEGKNYALAERYAFLNRLDQGDNRYAFNVLSGVYRHEQVQVGEYHYETHSTDSKGHRQTHHHTISFFILGLRGSFPELTIAREGLFSKIAQALGYDDIDFESHEFSRMFCVRSKDRKFAFDVCNARMIEYLLGNADLSVEIERDTLALVVESTLAVEEIEKNLGRLVEIRSRMPDYLFTGT